MLGNLADLMKRYEILRLHLPMGEANLEINHFPVRDLKDILVALESLGFSIECPLISRERKNNSRL